ncbi:MAG: cobyrinate a,c-diamide synthase [Candidatus Omnitrophica bacterium]|nr:cobyrinate a,c-diamide synthase [Candidatus Omnitrophota bacterium]
MSGTALPRVLVAGTHSGVGKTTVTVGILRALRRAGIAVQPFKVGPDYIDPGYLGWAAGRLCRNLDGWLVPAGRIPQLFAGACRPGDAAVVEGVMGLHDGAGALDEEGSSAQMSKLLRCPVLLVVDAGAMSRSAAALVKGFAGLDRRVRIAGCFVNRVGGPSHFRLVKEGIERLAGVPVIGCLPRDKRLELPERHLGLVPSREDGKWKRILGPLDRRMKEGLDLPALLRIMRQAPALRLAPALSERSPFDKLRVNGVEGLRVNGVEGLRVNGKVPIAVAWDEAFHFYYPENLELLGGLGAEVVPFSPLKSRSLPHGAAGLYLGGGFPELFAEPLSRNRALHADIRRAVGQGIPTYAECGGLMYLTRAIRDSRGKRHPMAGLIPAEVRMTPRLQNFGYQELRARGNTVLSRAGERARGHEFHHSALLRAPGAATAAYEVLPRRGGPRRLEGYARGSLLASYIHLHFWNRPRWAERFVESARQWEVEVSQG